MSRYMNVEQLIAEVKRRRPLWDTSNTQHHNRNILDRLWDEVAQGCSSASRTEVRIKWKNLKDTYRKELKKLPRIDGVIDRSYKPTWPYFGHMEFLREQMLARFPPELGGTFGLPTTPCDEGDVIADLELVKTEWKEEDEEIPLAKRLRLDSSSTDDQRPPSDSGQLDVETDEDYHFFMSILPHVKSLNPVQKLRFRSQVQNIIIYEQMTNIIAANGCKGGTP